MTIELIKTTECTGKIRRCNIIPKKYSIDNMNEIDKVDKINEIKKTKDIGIELITEDDCTSIKKRLIDKMTQCEKTWIKKLNKEI